jgi:hypothetical protein
MKNKKIFKVTISPVPFKRRPFKKEVPLIQDNFIYSGMTYDQLIYHSVQPNSYTIAPAVYKDDYRDGENWLMQQVYFLDFDGTISIQGVLDRFYDYDITPNFYYTTFSHTESFPRFRVVLLTDTEITNKEDGNRFRNGLKAVFPEADSNCFDAGRIFFGGIDCFPLTDEPIPYYKLDEMISLYIMEKDFGKTRGFVSEGVSLNNYKRDTQLQTFGYDEYKSYLSTLNNNKYDFEKLYQKVKIFKDFIDGKWLRHNQLFGLVTSLHWLKGGKKLFNDTMEKHNSLGNTHYSKEKFWMTNYMTKRGYFPMGLKKYSPYSEDWEYLNLITAVRLPIGKIERIKEQQWIKLDEAKLKFEQEFQRVLISEEKKIFIFKVQTGFGKTTELTNLKGHVIAFPTHDLKEEVSRKMKVKYLMTPRLPKFQNKIVNNKINNYYKMGLNEAVRKTLKSVAAASDLSTSIDDQNTAKKYLTELGNNYDSETTLLSTHQRVLLAEKNASTIIFDEDPIKDILSVNTLKLDDLLLINAYLPKESKFDSIIDQINAVEAGIVCQVKPLEINRETLCEIIAKNPVESNIVKFFNSIAFCKNKRNNQEIHYINKCDLSIDKKYIIMSATPQIHLYEKLYPGMVEVIDISNIEFAGKVYQHTDHSYSRSSLTDDLTSKISEDIGFIPVITFKKKKGKFSHVDHKMHFGNVMGYDAFNGDDIAIVGTPHLNDVVYRLFAFAVGIDPNGEAELRTRQVEYGDFRFCFKTFNSKVMQQIQLSLIESELIQAIGRARPLRNECVIELYSNFPIVYSNLKNCA